jgi:DNA-binding LacI/PurR family transcriptional regulator
MNMLGYARNRAARATRAKSSGSVGLVVCEESIRMFTDPFFSRVLWGTSQALSPRDLQLVLLTVSSPRDCRRISRYLRSGHVDGVMMVSLHGRLPLDVHSFGVPVVLAGRPPTDDETVSYVDADNAVGAETAVRHLIESGRKSVATVAGPPDMGPGIDRLRGYRKVTNEAGMPSLVVYGDFVNPSSAEHATRRLLDLRPGVDAVFAASDFMATGVMRALRRSGRRIPDDVAVIGFDDGQLALHTDPPLTTVRQPIEQIGARMTQELLTRMGDSSCDPCHVILDTELVLRDSA